MSGPAYDAGRTVLGPVIARFVRNLRLQAAAAGTSDEVALLFCARGGLRLRLAYEAGVQALGIGSGGHVADLMVSRLMAAKATLRRTPYATEVLLRECAGRSLAEAAELLLPPDRIDLARGGVLERTPLDRSGLRLLLEGEGALASAIRIEVASQAGAFAAHLSECAAGRRHLLLVDTGLYGGTMRLLEEGFPDAEWSCSMIGRSNHSGADAPHFPRTAGLVFEADRTVGHRPATALLRHWHLVEGLFEPALPSVTRLKRGEDGSIAANLQVPGWRDIVAARGNALFDGVMDHLAALRPSDLTTLDAQADAAERVLARMILRPGPGDVVALATAPRSWDFGRNGASPVISPVGGLGPRGRLWSVRRSLWREGQIRLAVPCPGLALQAFALGRMLFESVPGRTRMVDRIRTALRRRLALRTWRKRSADSAAPRIVNPSQAH
ncbi:hypothetical protein BHAOGJBA_1239 [Methylobacterium hispanicum]|uniref:Uncharacterized protein n=1 Tax=Methylobacterium hispanicum TaxID=270350 RepID=A0AAV4ZIL1_9HYPH|nr:hypothetical protein [Methylobacterium hispanicum]GJD87734.1 hypothetical protein BHAOGJBA_1239 [Methylobacterium hispanicum]